MNYPCIVFSQRESSQAPKFCVFEAPVKDVIEWSTIPRLSPDNQDGIQRAKNDTKVRGITKFLIADERNTIPTAIVITLSSNAHSINAIKGCGETINNICINKDKKDEVFVVDGQHRLYGLYQFNPDSKVPIVAILDATNEERAFQFIVINNKVSKVAPDHIRALTLKFTGQLEEAGLEQRLKPARLSLSPNLSYVGLANELDDSPFKGIVALPNIREDKQIVVPAAIEASIAYIQSKNIMELSSEDLSYEFFITIWTVIKESWPRAFCIEKKSKDTMRLMSKVGIFSMTRYITDAINFLSSFTEESMDLSNSQDVSDAVRKVLKMQAEEFWLADWDFTISDSKAVREQIHDALTSIQQNIRYNYNWSNDITFVKPTFS